MWPVLISARDGDLRRITTGFVHNSPSERSVRVDHTVNGSLFSSVFDYANTSRGGLLVDNIRTRSSSSDACEPAVVWRGYVDSDFPLIEADVLGSAGAVFQGLLERSFVRGYVAAASLPVPVQSPRR